MGGKGKGLAEMACVSTVMLQINIELTQVIDARDIRPYPYPSHIEGKKSATPDYTV